MVSSTPSPAPTQPEGTAWPAYTQLCRASSHWRAVTMLQDSQEGRPLLPQSLQAFLNTSLPTWGTQIEAGRHHSHPGEIPQFVTMNEEPEEPTICVDEDDYYCPVCQDVFRTPVRISVCQHLFCRKCFLMALKEGGAHCPLCRGIVTRKERARPSRALDVENNMKKLMGSCRCCDKQIRLSRMRQHYKSCKKYQDEYGDSSLIPSISQDSTGHSFRSDSSTSEVGENSTLQVPEEAANGHSTFKCPLCQESNFTRQCLLDHCNDRHLYQVEPAICPLCVSLPWGNPNQITRNFVGHLNRMHQFDYGDFMNLQLDEETQLRNAVEESCQVNL